jgi:hypothetical protein
MKTQGLDACLAAYAAVTDWKKTYPVVSKDKSSVQVLTYSTSFLGKAVSAIAAKVRSMCFTAPDEQYKTLAETSAALKQMLATHKAGDAGKTDQEIAARVTLRNTVTQVFENQRDCYNGSRPKYAPKSLLLPVEPRYVPPSPPPQQAAPSQVTPPAKTEPARTESDEEKEPVLDTNPLPVPSLSTNRLEAEPAPTAVTEKVSAAISALITSGNASVENSGSAAARPLQEAIRTAPSALKPNFPATQAALDLSDKALQVLESSRRQLRSRNRPLLLA